MLRGPGRSATFICPAVTGTVPVFLTVTARRCHLPDGHRAKIQPFGRQKYQGRNNGYRLERHDQALIFEQGRYLQRQFTCISPGRRGAEAHFDAADALAVQAQCIR